MPFMPFLTKNFTSRRTMRLLLKTKRVTKVPTHTAGICIAPGHHISIDQSIQKEVQIFIGAKRHGNSTKIDAVVTEENGRLTPFDNKRFEKDIFEVPARNGLEKAIIKD